MVACSLPVGGPFPPAALGGADTPAEAPSLGAGAGAGVPPGRRCCRCREAATGEAAAAGFSPGNKKTKQPTAALLEQIKLE